MKKMHLQSVVISGLLCMFSATLYAEDTRNKNTLHGFPAHAKSASIIVQGDELSEAEMLSLATLPIAEAVQIAQATAMGKVSQASLANEHHFLIWNVEVVTPSKQMIVLKIDAGNGELLAIGQDQPDKLLDYQKLSINKDH